MNLLYLPFSAEFRRLITLVQRTGNDVKFVRSRWFSDSLKDLLSKILVPDPSARIGLYNVIDSLTQLV